MIVTPLYMSLSALMLLVLSVLVIRQRFREQVALFGNDHPLLGRAIRAQGNFVEYVPMILLVMSACELMRGSHLLLHIAGMALLLGRVSHAYSITVVEVRNPKNFRYRMAGMILTFTVLGLLALWLLAMVLQVYMIG